MTIEARLRRIEPKVKQRSVKRLLSDVSRRLDGAGLDCLQVFGIHVARDILATCPSDRTALASLRDNGAWLAQRETEEPGFTRRIEGELSRLGLLDAEL